jgi:hypothetical protein
MIFNILVTFIYALTQYYIQINNIINAEQYLSNRLITGVAFIAGLHEIGLYIGYKFEKFYLKLNIEDYKKVNMSFAKYIIIHLLFLFGDYVYVKYCEKLKLEIKIDINIGYAGILILSLGSFIMSPEYNNLNIIASCSWIITFINVCYNTKQIYYDTKKLNS